MHLGHFMDEREAALAYDCKAAELKADRAMLNFPPTGHCQPQLTSHPRARRHTRISHTCEDFQRKPADYVSWGEGNRRWCASCAESHPGTRCRSNSCEDCQIKPASYDTLGEGKRRWCASCAESHPGARCLTGESREACQIKTASTQLDGCGCSTKCLRRDFSPLRSRIKMYL